jgi:antitoxin PrlF
MAAATVTSKGQITIPGAVRQSLGVEAGDRIEFIEVSPGRFEVIAATRPVTDLKGMFGPAPAVVSLESMNTVISRRGAAANGANGSDE